MSERNVADKQEEIADWIIENGGCGSRSEVDCGGHSGLFEGARCPVSHLGLCCFLPDREKIEYLSNWLEKYHQGKAEAAEAEKRKAETAKKEGQETKKTCGDCQHIYDADGSIEIGLPSTTLCHKKSIRVPIEFTGCRDFEPMAIGRMTLQSQYSAGKDGGESACAERVAQRKKDTEELCDLVELYAAAHAESKRAHFETKKDKADLTAKCERLTEQRNGLSNSLVVAMRRIKELESGDNILAQKIVDSVARSNRLSDLCNEKDGLIDRLRRDVANLLTDRSIMEGKMQLYVSPFR